MTKAFADAGSYRDPSGRVYEVGGEIYRAVMERAAPEFAHHQHQRRIQQPALLEIVHQGIDHAIDRGQNGRQPLFDSSPADLVAMMIEVAPGTADEHKCDAGFHETPGQNRFLADAFAAVRLAQRRRYGVGVAGVDLPARV